MKMKILIVYGTIEGQTRKIARFIEDVLMDAGQKVTIANATDDPPKPEGFDAVLIGSSIHIHGYNAAVRDYVGKNLSQLNNMPTAFFSVGMAIASEFPEEHEEVERITNHFLEKTAWRPVMTVQIAGALMYTQYDFLKRLVMKMIARKEGGSTDTSKDHEYTDWEAVRMFALDFLEVLIRKFEVTE